MAKDPAFLFYSADFMMGTALMNEAEVGQYIRILCHMHQSGHLSMEDMKNICPNISPKVVGKFKADSTGLYYNERLDKEVQKRKNYSESRRNNRLKGKRQSYDTTHDNHMSSHMENENVIVNEIRNAIEKEKGGMGERVSRATTENEGETNVQDDLQNAFDEIYLEQQRMKWPHLDFDFEHRTFCEKVRGSPGHYVNHGTDGLRLAFQAQLRNAKRKPNGKTFNKHDRTEQNANDLAIILQHAARGSQDTQ